MIDGFSVTFGMGLGALAACAIAKAIFGV